MHHPNTLISVEARQPLKSPSPDRKNKNRISHTTFQGNNVKRYLETVKNNHKAQPSTPVRVLQIHNNHLLPAQLANLSKDQQESLRRRIYELQVENNEYRVIAKECRNLANRNQQLQQQMILLLSELQEERSSLVVDEGQEGSPFKVTKYDHSTKTKFFTQQSSQEEDSPDIQAKSFRVDNSEREKMKTQPFRSVNIDSKKKSKLLEQNEFLQAQNERIKLIVDQQVKQSLKKFEEKFMQYLQDMEDKLEEMKKHNLEMFVLKNKERDRLHHSSSQSDSNQYHQLEIPIQKPPNLAKKTSEHSLINIDISGMLDSQQSFGRTQMKQKKQEQKHFTTPESLNKSSFNPVKEGSLDDRLQTKFTEVVISRVHQNIESIRENLTFILGEKSKINDPSILDFEEKVKKELKNILSTFFPDEKLQKEFRDSPMHTQLLNENTQMRMKIKELNQSIINLKKELKFKVDEVQQEIHHSELKIDSSRGLDFSYYKAQPQFSNQQFEQTEKRLIRVIKIMKSFNQEYQSILERSLALSFPQESSSKKQAQ